MISADVADHGVWWLAAVVAVHLVLLAAAVSGAGPSDARVAPTIVSGVLVPADAASPRVPAAQPSRPRPPPPAATTQSPLADAAPAASAPSAAAAPAREEAAPAVAGSSSTAVAPAALAADASTAVTPPRTDATQLNNPAPLYSALARRAGEQGRVLLDVYILADGSVGEARLKRSSGYARLDEAALAAVRRWRYVAARRGNEPIAYWYVQPIAFSLDS